MWVCVCVIHRLHDVEATTCSSICLWCRHFGQVPAYVMTITMTIYGNILYHLHNIVLDRCQPTGVGGSHCYFLTATWPRCARKHGGLNWFMLDKAYSNALTEASSLVQMSWSSTPSRSMVIDSEWSWGQAGGVVVCECYSILPYMVIVIVITITVITGWWRCRMWML